MGHESDAEGGVRRKFRVRGRAIFRLVVPGSFVPAIEPVKLGIWRYAI